MTAPESDHLRVGIIGTGAFGRRIGHQLLALPDATVVGLVDVSDEALDTAGEQLGVPASARYGEYRDLLDGERLDAVVVATPHTLHYEQITAALDRGLHVLSEKPLVVDVDQARELVDRADGSDQVLMVGYQRHLDSAFRRVRERYRSAGGPDPRRVTAEITQDWIPTSAGTWRTDPELSAGGFLTDTGRHIVDAVIWMTGRQPTAVRAEMEFHSPGIDRAVDLDIELSGGVTASIAAYGDVATTREQYHLWDDRGGARIYGRGWGSRSLVRVDADGGEYSPLLDRSAERTKGEAFVDAVLRGADLPATPRDALRATATIAAAYESGETGEWVDVDLPDGNFFEWGSGGTA